MKNLITLFKKTEELLTKKKKINQNEDKENITTDKNYFCCPKCKEGILISLNPKNFTVSYKCKNNHQETKLDYNLFYNDRYISKNNDLFCDKCKKEKLNNKIIKCNVCNINLCEICIIKHNKENKHNNFLVNNDLINKCPEHDIDISQFCKTCEKNLCSFCLQKGEKMKEHLFHKIINFSDLIPDDKEINENNNKLKNKIIKNDMIISKLKEWKKEICSLINDIINHLLNEKMINQMIIKNFNYNYLKMKL